MNKLVFKPLSFIIVALMTVLTSCDKEPTLATDDVENFVDETIFEMHKRGNLGKMGCQEFVFPISIEFEDGSISEVADYPELRSTLKEYKENNPEAQRPSLVFPLEVVTQQGDLISLESSEELHDLNRRCARHYFRKHDAKGHRFRGMFCFKLQYPLVVVMPDDTEVDVENPWDLHRTLRRWRANNPQSEDRPALQFPVTVILEDETEVEIADRDALQELKDSCGE